MTGLEATAADVVDTLVPLIRDNLELSAAVVAWVASWILYGFLGKRHLGADDDYWEAIRARLLPVIDTIGQRYGLYAETRVTRREYAGYVEMGEEVFEEKLRDAGYLRQPLASMHVNSLGWKEDGSWARAHGLMFPVALLVARIPAVGGPIGRFVSALDTIASTRQTHIMNYTERLGDGRVRTHIYCHDEANPVNPVFAFAHYTAIGWRASPDLAVKHLETVGVDVVEADAIEQVAGAWTPTSASASKRGDTA
jgi:hypothetical protein